MSIMLHLDLTTADEFIGLTYWVQQKNQSPNIILSSIVLERYQKVKPKSYA